MVRILTDLVNYLCAFKEKSFCSLSSSLIMYVGVSSLAGLCLCDDAKMGLCKVPGGRWVGRGVVGGPFSGSRTGSLLSAWPLLQCCNHTGTTLRTLHALCRFQDKGQGYSFDLEPRF